MLFSQIGNERLHKFNINNSLVIFILLSIIININLGYTLTFDMSWGPQFPLQSNESNTWILFYLIHYSGLVFNWLPQKIILFSVFFMTGFGAFKFFQKIAIPKQSMIAYFVGIIYIFNPYVYTRLMAGQWLVLLGYALLPLAALAIYRFIYTPNSKDAGFVLLWLLLIGFTSIHTLPIVALTVVVLGTVALVVAYGNGQIDATFWRRRQRFITYSVVIVLAWILINLTWLIPLITGKSNAGQSIDSFTSSAGGSASQLEAFATHGTIFGSPALSALGLTGFWADGQGRYLLPSGIGWPWYIAAILIISLAVLGAVFSIKRRNVMGITLAISGIIAWFLAVGIASPLTAPLTLFLNQYVPLYAGFREPQKWLMLLALAYAYLGAIGLSWIINRLSMVMRWQKLATPVMIFALIIPIIFAPNLAWGAGGQLRSVQYPDGWKQAAEYLEKQPGSADNPKQTKIVVLPWHMYLNVDFVGRVVANPTRYYFPQDIIVGDNTELRGVPPQQQNDLSSYINNTLFPQRNSLKDIGQTLSKDYGVDYVMFLKEADYADINRYGWISRQTDFKPVLDNKSMTLYKMIN